MPRAAPDIQIRRVYDPVEPNDGARILVDRLWPRGVKKEEAKLTLWLKDVAPSSELRQWFNHDPIKWREFTRLYRAELATNQAAVDRLWDFLKRGRVTLLYGARDTSHNDAVVLADYLRRNASL
jgi:uncharacterized protein YeaO (DUF488 family)